MLCWFFPLWPVRRRTESHPRRGGDGARPLWPVHPAPLPAVVSAKGRPSPRQDCREDQPPGSDLQDPLDHGRVSAIAQAVTMLSIALFNSSTMISLVASLSPQVFNECSSACIAPPPLLSVSLHIPPANCITWLSAPRARHWPPCPPSCQSSTLFLSSFHFSTFSLFFLTKPNTCSFSPFRSSYLGTGSIGLSPCGGEARPLIRYTGLLLVGQQLAPLRPGSLLIVSSTLPPIGRAGVHVVVLPHNLLPSGGAGAMRTTLTGSRSSSFVRGSFFAAAAQTCTLARGHIWPLCGALHTGSIGRRFSAHKKSGRMCKIRPLSLGIKSPTGEDTPYVLDPATLHLAILSVPLGSRLVNRRL